ncbi:MAG: ribosome silencing factor [Marinilabiliales bacterium]|nr:MAG: ribosome silencing factor [Marinilabiliales bacterium]
MADGIREISTEALLGNIIEGIRKVKGKDIINIDLADLEHRVCSHFVICHGDSNIHVNSIANSVDREVRQKTGRHLMHKEGQDNAQWVLLDFGSIVVHVFQKEYREFYRLEELWGDGKIEKFE